MSGTVNWSQVLTLQLAVARARTSDDRLGLAHRVRHLGDAFYRAGRATLAEPCFVEALALYRGHPLAPLLDLANAIRSFAVLKHEAGATTEARQLWQEAHDLYATVQVPAGVAESAARLANLALQQGDLQRSREYLSEATAAADASGDPETMAYVRDAIAQLES